MSQLIAESTRKRAVQESGLLNENPLIQSDIPKSLDFIKKHADYTSYHLLLAIRKYYPVSYKGIREADKSAILCSALKSSKWLNDWGSLSPSESFDGESARALLETGRAALAFLAPILNDSKDALLFGSKEATASTVYSYRRKDFAYRYASLILEHSPSFSSDVKERDKRIESLKAILILGRK